MGTLLRASDAIHSCSSRRRPNFRSNHGGVVFGLDQK